MKTIECNTISQDTYPAGLYLASSIWTTARIKKKANFNILGIERYYDGVKLKGTFNRKQFEAEINYATEKIVLLSIKAKKGIFESTKKQEQFEDRIKLILENIIETIENRKLINKS